MWLCRLTVAVLASSHNVKALDPIDKVTVVTLKVRDNCCRPQVVPNATFSLIELSQVERKSEGVLCSTIHVNGNLLVRPM